MNIGALHFPHKSGVTVADNIQTTNCHTGVDLKVRITKTMREACLERCKSAHSRDWWDYDLKPKTTLRRFARKAVVCCWCWRDSRRMRYLVMTWCDLFAWLLTGRTASCQSMASRSMPPQVSWNCHLGASTRTFLYMAIIQLVWAFKGKNRKDRCSKETTQCLPNFCRVASSLSCLFNVVPLGYMLNSEWRYLHVGGRCCTSKFKAWYSKSILLVAANLIY